MNIHVAHTYKPYDNFLSRNLCTIRVQQQIEMEKIEIPYKLLRS